MIIYLAVISCFLALVSFQYLGKRRSRCSPLKEIPVEKGLPFIGVLTQIEKPICNYFMKLGKKHGPIFRVQLGMRKVVILNSYEYIKAALVENSEALSGRWKGLKQVMQAEKSGIVFIDGHHWTEHRSFVMKSLRDFGIGRSKSVEVIRDECEYLLEELEQKKGKSVNLPHLLYPYTLNVIAKFLMNRRFRHGDRGLEVLDNFMTAVANEDDSFSNLLMMFPFIENVDWLCKFLARVTSRKSIMDDCHDFMESEIQDHLSKLDFNSEGDDLMDAFLIKQRQLKERNGNNGTFTNFQLARNAVEILAGGYDTKSTILVWGSMLLSTHPEVQDRVHEEIINTIGKERLPTISDKVSLNYTQAVMDEILRLSCVFPLSIVHRTLADVNVKGYFIPKDTVIHPNLFASHLDPDIWEKPLEFYPGHFLSADSEGNLKYKPRESLIVFSMGKRVCLGESLARMEYFMFFTSILQRFHIDIAKGKAQFDVFQSNNGMIRTPPIQEFILT